MKKSAAKSWDSVATRELWGAINRHDVQGVVRALSKKANPNEQKRINPWTAADTPLLKASRDGFTQALEILVKAGARRRSSGKDASSAFMCAVEGDHPETFDALCRLFDGITAMEALECCVAIRSFRGNGAEQKIDAWVDRLIDAMQTHKVRLTPAPAAAITMQFLGGEGLNIAVYPDQVRKLMDCQILTSDLVSRATDACGLGSWGEALSSRDRKRNPNEENEAIAVALLHELRFPFAAMAAAQQSMPSQWLQEQVVHSVAVALQSDTSQVAGPARDRPRL